VRPTTRRIGRLPIGVPGDPADGPPRRVSEPWRRVQEQTGEQQAAQDDGRRWPHPSAHRPCRLRG
jgi:hypothetical protein